MQIQKFYMIIYVKKKKKNKKTKMMTKNGKFQIPQQQTQNAIHKVQQNYKDLHKINPKDNIIISDILVL